MGKISPVSAKYIAHALIEIEGVVDRPDVIGAIFGQTEGLLGADLELRELQRSGRIGRIEVNVETKSGKTKGSIIIPSSLDKAETSIVAAALEVIQRIGPCNAKIHVSNIEDVRVSKRNFVVERAKELLKAMMDNVLPDSQELADEVAYSVRVMEIMEYGKDRLPAGPGIEESDEIIIVEGRADVLNLLKFGFKNAIAINGTSIPHSIIELTKAKTTTVFVDGDRGGDLIIKELTSIADIDFITKAPDGKEVEEITKKEIHKALRSKISIEQAKHDIERKEASSNDYRSRHSNQSNNYRRKQPYTPQRTQSAPRVSTPKPQLKTPTLSQKEKSKFKGMLEDLIGTRGGYILNDKLSILGKVPITELVATIKSLKTGMYAIVFDGSIDKNIIKAAEEAKIKFIVAMASLVRPNETAVGVVTLNGL